MYGNILTEWYIVIFFYQTCHSLSKLDILWLCFFFKINNVHVSLQSWDTFIFLFYLPMSLYSISELPSNSSKFNPVFWVLKRCHFSISQERFTTMLVHILLVIRMTILTSLIHATPLWQGCFHSSNVYVSPWNRNIK